MLSIFIVLFKSRVLISSIRFSFRLNYYKVKIITNVKIIAKHVKCQNYHENKYKFIYIKLNILNSNTSEITKL